MSPACFSSATSLLLSSLRQKNKLCRIQHKTPRFCVRSSLDDALIHELREHLQREQLAVREDDNEPPLPAQILSYTSLASAGRPDLVERIMDAGGYPAALDALGVEPLPKASPAPRAPSGPLFASEHIEGRLALGVGREKRLSAPVSNDASSGPAEPRTPARDDILSAEEIASISANTPKQDVVRTPEGELFVLGGQMRMGAFALMLLISAGYGRSSVEVFSAETRTILQGAANALMIMHGAFALYAAVICKMNLRRSALLWFAKTLIAGPAAVVVLDRLGAIPEEEG